MSGKDISGKRYFTLSDEQRLNWLRLIRSQNVGPATFRDLISGFGTAAAAIEALPELAKSGGLPAKIKICPVEDAEVELRQAEKIGARFITLGEPDYPPILRHSDQSPPVICIKGNIDILHEKCVGIVGSRNCSVAGIKLTQRFAGQLGEKGYTIVSGLARGIDTAAHRASLLTGTAAIFAGGIDHIFPEENTNLASSILDNNGICVTEMPIGWQPKAIDFPRRNRIVTGLSLGVIVVEAAKRSGSLITARLANEIGRLVMAVPGSPLDPRSEGTNGLIRNGATLITNIEDVIDALTPLHAKEDNDGFIYDIFEGEETLPLEGGEPTYPENTDENMRQAIITALGPSPTEIDDIIRFTNATAGQVQLVLLELSIAGKLEHHTGNRVSLI